MDHSIFKKRIRTVQNTLKSGDVLLLFAASLRIRNRDVEYKFRQDSDYYYLTGIEEEDGILALRRDYSVHFALPKDKEREIWTGIRLGKKEIGLRLELDESYDLGDWDSKIGEILTNQYTLYHFFGKEKERDSRLLDLVSSLNQRLREGKFGPQRLEIPNFLHEMRMIKSPEEIDKLKESSRITAFGHERLMRETRPGMYEFELEAILESEYLKHGAWGGGYGHIVAAGKNATILHYTTNRARIGENEAILVDSGAEKDYYTADVTRVFPSGKKFTAEQKAVYELVLYAQKEAISNTLEGVEFNAVHESTIRTLTSGLKDMGFLKGDVSGLIEKGEFRRFYMHRTGHYLGMDVHDVGRYFENGKSKPMRNGLVVTVEPGLYFDPSDENIPDAFRGIGVRIEDDVLVNGKSPIVLTEMIPKEIDEIESLRT
ncbi:metallopeptidase family M24 [Leptospira broomii serovar Hurstbridge str. 5399]|uniref:Xaa-Pro aminopeptidase n=1 Tax=Leptospira broomii serovar Hurstbridge str. 5399 TaxID=1049789 RepID=T0GG26_9LEPT|nr:aminopeptidase P N-terminal domain-containing protein [Leptospira broomii]EQA45794.1 metallopeptidase family M24 [Leptospira broomii serovar Hurstbridge str. 5399]